MRFSFLTVITFVMILFIQIDAQNNLLESTSGYLIRIGLYENDLSKSDTVDSWMDYKDNLGRYVQTYDDAFINNGTNFVIRDYARDTYVISAWGFRLINKLSGSIFSWSGYSAEGTATPMLGFNPGLNKITLSNGKWLSYIPFNNHSSCFLSEQNKVSFPVINNDSIRTRAIYIAGKVNNKYLVAVNLSSRTANYYLDDLENSPRIDTSYRVTIVEKNFNEKWAPKKIIHLQDSLYLVVCSKLTIMKFFNDQFLLIKEISNPLPQGSSPRFQNSGIRNLWFCANKFLYYFNDTTKTFIKSTFDSMQNDFVGQEVLFSNLYGSVALDDDGNYLANLNADTLFIYSIKKEKLVNKISVKGTQLKSTLIVSPPYVYLQRIDKITDVIKEEKLPAQFSLAQNYPNPFNPTTIISFKLQAASYVTLKVYDVLGREVATIVDEYKTPGSYNAQWTIDNGQFTSGVYFYTLRAGNYVQTKKMVLVK